MAFSISNVLSSLGSTSTVFDDATGEFNLIDVEGAKRELKLSVRAAENGAREIPGTEESRKDAMATEIDTYINHLVLLAKNKFADRLRASDDLTDAQSQGSMQFITEIFENARAELKATARDRYDAMFTARRDWVLGEKQISTFRAENKRIGPARYPDDRTKIFGWIFLITIIEIMTNAYALGAAHPNGPVGVILEIFMFGIANVGVAFLLGCYVWRYFYHISVIKRIVATILALPMMAFIVFLNFFLAHYRDAISKLVNTEFSTLQTITLMQQLGGQARDTLIANPVVMDDFKSYLLLFVGMLASIFATRKSFELDDPYPGYGKLSREQKELAMNFNDEQKFAFKDINDLVDDYSNQINSQLDLIKSKESAAVNRERDKKQLFEKYNNWRTASQSVGATLYAFYREENMKARRDRKEPECFKIDFVLSDETKVELEPPKIIKSNYKTIENSCKKYLNELNEQSTKFQDKFKDIAKMSPDEALSDRFKEPTVFRD